MMGDGEENRSDSKRRKWFEKEMILPVNDSEEKKRVAAWRQMRDPNYWKVVQESKRHDTTDKVEQASTKGQPCSVSSTSDVVGTSSGSSCIDQTTKNLQSRDVLQDGAGQTSSVHVETSRVSTPGVDQVKQGLGQANGAPRLVLVETAIDEEITLGSEYLEEGEAQAARLCEIGVAKNSVEVVASSTTPVSQLEVGDSEEYEFMTCSEYQELVDTEAILTKEVKMLEEKVKAFKQAREKLEKSGGNVVENEENNEKDRETDAKAEQVHSRPRRVRRTPSKMDLYVMYSD